MLTQNDERRRAYRRVLAAGSIAVVVALLATGMLAVSAPRASLARVATVASLAAPKPPHGMDSVLDGLGRASRDGGSAAAAEYAASRGLMLVSGSVQVVLEAAPAEQARVTAAVQHAGGKVTGGYGGLLVAWVPVGSLGDIAAMDGVAQVRPPASPKLDVTSEGVSETGASTLHSAGVDGSGVKVGIIDGGFTGYAAKLGGELPSSVTTWGGGSLGKESTGTVHGTAVAEVVHDMAPGAQLYLARIDNEVDLGNAKDWMKANGVTVVNHSMGWYGTEGGDGTGLINSIVDDAVSNGIFWANSAGNDRRRHWMGDFADTDFDDKMNWDGTAENYNTFKANAGSSIVGFLRWDDSWGNANRDFEFYLYRWTGSEWRMAASSTNTQDMQPGCYPVESINIKASSTTTYAWVIAKFRSNTDAVSFDLTSWYQDLDDPTNTNPHFFDHERSISVPADNGSDGFMAAAAVGRSPGFAQESYSSEGPTRDGRTAPEIAAPSSVSNSVYAPSPFAGTSASSPHLAGAAALVKDSAPISTPAQIESRIESMAVDLGAAGPDNLYGNGRLMLDLPGAAPNAVDDTATIAEDETLVVAPAGVLANDSDPDGDSMTATGATDPPHGTVALSAGGGYTYTPDADWNGIDTFSYRAHDGVRSSAPATVTITVTPVNDAPVAHEDTMTVAKDGTVEWAAPGILGNDTDVDSDTLTAQKWDGHGPYHGGANISGNGYVQYWPDAGFVGTDTFSYRAYDGTTYSQYTTVTITVFDDVVRSVTRVGGSDRYAVAEGLARKGWDPAGDKSWPGVTHVIVTCGDDRAAADPLAAAGLAGVYDAPVLLTASGSLPNATARVIREIAAQRTLYVHIVGGTSSVPDARWNQIKAITGVSPTKDRIAGADRYAVTAEIAKRMISVAGTANVPGALIVCSENANAFYDALAASPVAFRNKMPMLGVRSSAAVPPSVRSVLNTNFAGKPRYVVSGTGYISAAVYTAVGGTGARLATSSNRYTAATQIADAALTAPWLHATDTGIAAKLPDALTGGAFLGKRDGVMLFTGSSASMDSTSRSWIDAHGADITNGWVFGGTLSVPESQRTEFLGLLL